MNATPRPWKVEKSGFTQSRIYICDASGKIIFSTADIQRSTEEAEANAIFIETCVNVHDIVVKKVIPALIRINVAQYSKEMIAESRYALDWLAKAGVK